MSDKAKRRLALRAERAMGLDAAWVGAPAAQVRGISSSSEALRAVEAPVPVKVVGVNLFERPVVGDAAEAMPVPRRIELLGEMDRGEVSVCTRCGLHKTRTHTVFGEGDPAAQLMFIGEGPGENEDLTGRPFVGRAGQLLDKMIAAMGLRREQVYIANLVKCRPPGNRTPMPDEVSTCLPYLVRQIELIGPRVIVTLGLPASRYMLESSRSMGQMRGSWHAWRGIKVMPTYHPAYILRSYNQQTRAAVWSDLQQVMSELGLARSRQSGALP
jgi:uracil-DNA glycosylase